MRLFRRLICFVSWHRDPGYPHGLYRYSVVGDPQSPITRGPTRFVRVGFECIFCGKRVLA